MFVLPLTDLFPLADATSNGDPCGKSRWSKGAEVRAGQANLRNHNRQCETPGPRFWTAHSTYIFTNKKSDEQSRDAETKYCQILGRRTRLGSKMKPIESPKMRLRSGLGGIGGLKSALTGFTDHSSRRYR